MDYRDTWNKLDLTMLQDWVTNKRQEGLHLDFKQLTSAPNVTRDDRKIFASAVSGFANSDGGIIVWGVEAKKDADGVDAAQSLKPLKDPKVVLGTLQSHTGDAASPTVDGVDHKFVEDGAGGGFVATIVPVSERGPHMAGLGESRYYKRNGDSFIKMEHVDVADMFGRRAKPVLEVVLVDMMGSYTNESAASYEPIIAIRNSGRGVARFPFLRIKLSPPFGLNRQFGLRNGETGLPERPQFGRRESPVFAGGQDHVIHPGTVLDVHRIVSPRGVSLNSAGTMEDLVIEFEVTCEGVQLTSGCIEKTGAQIVEFGQADIRAKYPPRS
jgi:hypothetical protein